MKITSNQGTVDYNEQYVSKILFQELKTLELWNFNMKIRIRWIEMIYKSIVEYSRAAN